MRPIVYSILAAISLLATGCVGMTATPAVQGKAYVVDGSLFGTSLYNCEVANGEPICWEVEKIERPEAD